MPDKKFAFVLSYPDNADPVKFDSRLPAEIRQYQESLGDKSNLDFFDAKHTESGYALSRSDIAGILNQSKIYVHMCRREGESRSLGEALACGCHLALHSDFVGGATDICNKDNSIRFSTSSDLETQIRSVLESGVDSEKNAAEYAEIRSRTLIQLRSLLREYGMDQTEIDELFLQDLSMVLPGHTSPQFPRAKYTGNADITDINEFCGFLKLCGIEVEPSKLRFFEFALRMRSLLVNLAQSIKSRKVF
ncbi:glycosyltransferase [Marinobacter sp. es.042]|uniref:glycosyltransferase n=1 Tax=Marinobacter sp. es.042 TaxID=1761794 RepID=UPI0012FA1B3D|nr:glycosyltransferase [Marinobacter sp. es.042]